MLSPLALAAIGGTVFGTSFLSGIFGMAGGMILLGVLLIWFDVPQAMVIFGLIQLISNGWRAVLWRAHIGWRIIAGFCIGGLAAAALFRLTGFVPSKLVIFLGLGLTPLIIDRLPKALSVDITRPGMPVICGAVTVIIQFIAGAAGHILDQFFQKSLLDRKQTVATKATSQVIAHLIRVAYFGSFAGALDPGVSWGWMGAALVLSIAGTSSAALVLERMSDTDFKRWSRIIVLGIAAFYLIRAALLLMA